MKYIRTDDGKIIDRRITFKFPTEPPTIVEAVLDYEVTMTNPPTQPYIIIKEADTIEELCDEFVYCFKEAKPILVSEENIKQLTLLGLLKFVYGAIWTSKGLIYVAKMNSEGVLELI